MLAGRKLLLADDSITIQKVVALTFADEGVEVVTVSDGQEAIEKLQETTPDIVLADVFMPKVSGYEVCRYIKQNAKLKHIPVMLLVGSFEPFDEAEARRVGADDTLTKPFQSIRRLIDKVGGLVGSKRATDATTAELPPVHQEPAEPAKLSNDDLEINTANTQPLPVAMQHPADPTYGSDAAVQGSDFGSYEPAFEAGSDVETEHVVETKPAVEIGVPGEIPENFQESEIMDSPRNQLRNENTADAEDVLLDLGDIDRMSASASDDFVLDLDFDGQTSDSSTATDQSPSDSSTATDQSPLSDPWMDTSELADRHYGLPSSDKKSVPATDQRLVDTQEWMRGNPLSTSRDLQSEPRAAKFERVVNDAVVAEGTGGSLNLDQLSPEMIDAIARRVVEQLSARVVEEIAWEVVPQLAELLIKRKLEENQSLPK